MTHKHTKGCCCVLDSVSSTPLVTITVVQNSTEGHFLPFISISLSLSACPVLPEFIAPRGATGVRPVPPYRTMCASVLRDETWRHGGILSLMFSACCVSLPSLPLQHTPPPNHSFTLSQRGRRWGCSGWAPLTVCVGGCFFEKTGEDDRTPQDPAAEETRRERGKGWNPDWRWDTEDMRNYFYRQLKWKLNFYIKYPAWQCDVWFTPCLHTGMVKTTTKQCNKVI